MVLMLEKILPDMRTRIFVPELMDDQATSKTHLFQTLDQFETINRLLTRSRWIAERHFFRHMRNASPGAGSFRLIDLGCGGADFSRWLVMRARYYQVPLQVTGVDNDPRVVEYAREACRSYPEVKIVESDILDPALWKSPFDYAFSNHLLHHLPQSEIAGLVQLVGSNVRHGFVLNDIERSRPAYLFFWCLAGTFFRNSFTLRDGLLSIRKAFRVAELRNILSNQAGKFSAKVDAVFPWRLIVYGMRGEN
ncbi:MAG: methyltransferase domain-containing protein [Chitinivibrionales bacterium]|nr:methyltransferase domain-containing protein [Chitinivibrionales bacterium]